MVENCDDCSPSFPSPPPPPQIKCCIPDTTRDLCEDYFGICRPNRACCVETKNYWDCETMMGGLVIDACEDCNGVPPTPACVPTDKAQQGIMVDRLEDGSQSYCLLIDNFNGVRTQFNCLNVVWTYNGADTITMSGLVYGLGEEWHVWSTYTGISPSTLFSSHNNHTLIIYNDRKSYTFQGKQNNVMNFALALNVRPDVDPRSESLYTVEANLDGVLQRGFLECGESPPVIILTDPRRNWCCSSVTSTDCRMGLPFDPSTEDNECRVIDRCSECICLVSEDCKDNRCCDQGFCRLTADQCLHCPGEPDYGQCLEIHCNTDFNSLIVNGINVNEILSDV